MNEETKQADLKRTMEILKEYSEGIPLCIGCNPMFCSVLVKLAGKCAVQERKIKEMERVI